jgi:ATP-dependent RNA helicase DHX57
LFKQIQTLGFSEKQVQNAINALSTPSILSSTLLSSFEPLQACLEYLILHLPECDLPQRFLPASNSSSPFVSSIHAGTEDLKARWVQDKAVKECGWPAHIVKELLSDKVMVEDWGLLQRSLNYALLGRTDEDPSEESADREAIDEDELQAYDARFVDKTHLLIPLPIAPIQLHIIFPSERHTLPLRGEPPWMYITSTTVAAYVRLHMLSELLNAFLDNTLVDPGETIIMAAVRFLEEQWASIEDNGPPEISYVLRHFLRRSDSSSETSQNDIFAAPAKQSLRAHGRRTIPRRDNRNDKTVKADFERMRRSKGYADVLTARTRLPAFAAQEAFLDLLATNRCVVVVGETGKLLVLVMRSIVSLFHLSYRLWKDYSA